MISIDMKDLTELDAKKMLKLFKDTGMAPIQTEKISMCPVCHPVWEKWKTPGNNLNYDELCEVHKAQAYKLILAHNKLIFLK